MEWGVVKPKIDQNSHRIGNLIDQNLIKINRKLTSTKLKIKKSKKESVTY